MSEEDILWEGDSDERMFKAEEPLEDEVSDEKIIANDNGSVVQLNESSDSEHEQENEVHEKSF